MKIFLHLSRFARHVFLACLVSSALALSVIRFWLLPQAADWREELQSSIGAMIDETVRIRSLSAGMRGFHPELMMRGFHIENASQDGPSLEFDHLGVGVDPLGSLLSGKPVINRIELEGGHIRLYRKTDGSVAIAGLKPSGTPLWLFAEGEVIFSDIDLEWAEGKSGEVKPLGRAQARLRNLGERHILDLRVTLPGKLGKSARLSAALKGEPTHPDTWNGKIYLEARHLREGAFVPSLPARLRSGEMGFRAWGEVRAGAFGALVGRLDLDHPVLTWRSATGAEKMIGVDRLAGWLKWGKEKSGWRLDIERLALIQNGRAWPETSLALSVDNTAGGGLQSLRAAVGYLNLADAQSFLGVLPPLEGKVWETLRALSLRGEVRSGRLIYQADGHFGFCGDLAGLSFKAVGDLPGIDHLSGRLCGNDRAGRIDLDSTRTELNLARLFHRPITLDAASGRLEWRRNGGKPQTATVQPAPLSPPHAIGALPKWSDASWHIVGNQIELAAPGLRASGAFTLDLLGEASVSPFLELNAKLYEIDAARLRDFLPLVAMDAEAASWLDAAFVGGKVKQAEVLLRGRLEDFPFAHGEGLFETRAETENMELVFDPAWPRLHVGKANILFFGPTLFVDAPGGRIGDISLGAIHADTPNFVDDGRLNVTGETDTDLVSSMKFLQQTPIRRIPERLLKAGEPEGDAHLDLKLSIPLTAGTGEVAVNGRLRLKNDILALKGVNLKVEGLSGQLEFTERSMMGRQITGKALDEPILVDVDQKSGDILFDISGKAEVTALRKSFPAELWNYANGGFNYRLNLQIPESLDAATNPIRLGLSSDLAGLELKLPAPLTKSASVKKDFSAEAVFRQNDRASLRLVYGQEGRARLVFSGGDSPHLESGDLIWGKPPPSSSDATGLGIFLKLEKLDIGAWRKILGEQGEGGVLPLPHALDIQVGRLLWDGEEFGSLSLIGQQRGGDLVGELDCMYGKGNYSAAMPEFGRAILRLDLDNLNLPRLPKSKEGQAPEAAPDPASLPSLQVRARHLLRQGTDLGALNLETERWTSGVNIKKLTLHAGNHDLGVKGHWMRQEGRDETKLEGRLKVRDLGKFLTLLGYDREILFTPTESAFSLSWAGAPQHFTAASVSGDIRLKLGRGRVLQMEPGFGRALGVLNLYTLRRLLMLDFSDLFGKGLAYDSMEGSFHLGDGQAVTKGFLIDAVAANILIIGRVGLVSHDFDETVSVIPHTLASLPLAGAYVGGAALGAIIDMAHRLLGEEDANIASTNYSITGSWEYPKIKRIEGNMPLDMLDRAWSGIKEMSGLGNDSGNHDE